jgi:Mn2+/Fe2+ NRAMP family transporter
VGRYHWLERLNKLFMLILSLSTIAATILVLPRIDWAPYPATAPAMDLAALMFVAALAGWMPTPIETSVFSSLWTIEKAKRSRHGRLRFRALTTGFQSRLLGHGFPGDLFSVPWRRDPARGSGTPPADSLGRVRAAGDGAL